MKPEEMEIKACEWFAKSRHHSLLSLCGFLGLSLRRFGELESRQEYKETIKRLRNLCEDPEFKNYFWQVKYRFGRPPMFETPEALWAAAVEWFRWMEENPLYEEKVFHHKGMITRTKVPKMRAMTVDAFCLFLDCSFQNWFEYKRKPEFSEVTQRIEKIIRSQKFTGAAADLLNPNIIARDLGLVDKTESDSRAKVENSYKITFVDKNDIKTIEG